jgi:nucleoside-diphosphate-sugar epimerase
MSKRILICGASGFMGRNIAEFFKGREGVELFGISWHSLDFPSGVVMYTADLTRKSHVDEVFKSVKPDVVIQAAAVTSGVKDILSKPYLHVTDNVIMNSLILKACYDFNVNHFIFLSCGVMYQPGEEPRKETDFNESNEIHPAYFGVGWMKVYVEKQMEFYSRLGKTKHTVIRHSNTYGPYDKYGKEESHMFAATIDKVMKAQDGDTIEVWGTGEETSRDLIYVGDVCDFIYRALSMQTDSYKLYNVGYEVAFTVKDVVEQIIKISGKNLNIKYNKDKPVIPTKLSLNCDKAFTELNWVADTPFEEGIKKTMEWYKNNIH